MYRFSKENIVKIIYPSLLVLVVLIIFYTNYVPNTFLIGWDSLQTELNPWVAVKRAFFSVWQEYQSFGLTSGMAHASDLLRSILVWLMSFVVPISMVRYLFHLLMLLAGALGVFSLARYLLGSEKEKDVFAFLGALFYLLNFGTVQIFSVPFEPFSIFFAMLPWELLAFLRYLEKPSKRHLISLFVINILSTPQAYLQTLFVVYILILIFLSLGYLLKKLSLEKFKNVLTSLVVILLVNAFWILPQIYFIKTSLGVVNNSKINQIATQPTYYRNVEKGSIKYLSRFEGFYYDLFDVSGKELFSSWKQHFSIQPVYYLSFLPFIIVLLGLVFGKNKYKLSIFLTFIFLTLVFLGSTFPINYIHEFFRNIPLVSQVFRSPFTKFIVPLSLVSSILFCFGLERVFRLFEKRTIPLKDIVSLFFGLLFVGLIVLISFPVFKGNMFLTQMKMPIPNSYFKVFEYFNTQDKNKRIALLPDYTYWGWFKTNWGYDGSGFLWYGVEQSVVSRTFDVWSNESESYFWEIKDAIESQDVLRFEEVLNKYAIDYLVVDYTLEPVAAQKAGLQYDQIASIVRLSSKIHLEQSFGGISILSFERNTPNPISISTNLYSVGPGVEITDYDKAYFDIGGYYSSMDINYDYFYPFLGLGTQNNGYRQGYKLYEEEEYLILEVPLQLGLNAYEIDVPRDVPRAKIFDGEKVNYYDLEVTYELSEDKLVVRVKKEVLETIDLEKVKTENCLNNIDSFYTEMKGGNLYINSRDRAVACFGYGRPFLALWNSYLVKVRSQNVEGRPLFFYIVGGKSRDQSKVETYLDENINYFILKPGYFYDDGYGFGFQNISYEGIVSTNLLEELSIYLFPYDYLKNIRFIRKGTPTDITLNEKVPEFNKMSYVSYLVKGGISESEVLVLYQSFDPGWVAFCRWGLCSANHVEVNNWSNGWVFSGNVSDNVKILFWPQYLQYFGYLLFVIPLFVVIKTKNNDKKSVNNITPHSIDKN